MHFPISEFIICLTDTLSISAMGLCLQVFIRWNHCLHCGNNLIECCILLFRSLLLNMSLKSFYYYHAYIQGRQVLSSRHSLSVSLPPLSRWLFKIIHFAFNAALSGIFSPNSNISGILLLLKSYGFNFIICKYPHICSFVLHLHYFSFFISLFVSFSTSSQLTRFLGSLLSSK